MSVKIRCKRLGRKNRPFFRVAVMDTRTRRNGPSIEDLGFYDTLAKTEEGRVRLDLERIKHWLSVGAQPSETVRSILKKLGVNQAPIVVASRSKKTERKHPRKRGGAGKKAAARPAAKKTSKS